MGFYTATYGLRCDQCGIKYGAQMSNRNDLIRSAEIDDWMISYERIPMKGELSIYCLCPDCAEK